jgi:hypothetical protein
MPRTRRLDFFQLFVNPKSCVNVLRNYAQFPRKPVTARAKCTARQVSIYLKSLSAGHVLCRLRSDPDPSPVREGRAIIIISGANDQYHRHSYVMCVRWFSRGYWGWIRALRVGPAHTIMHMCRQRKSIVCIFFCRADPFVLSFAHREKHEYGC